MGSLLKSLTLLSALLLLAIAGYLLFVSYQAPKFLMFGDLETIALVLFLVAGILIAVWIVSGILSRKSVEA